MVTYAKISPKSGEPQRYSWGTQKKTNKQRRYSMTFKSYVCNLGDIEDIFLIDRRALLGEGLHADDG